MARDLVVDLGDIDVADKIKAFMNPIKSYRRFHQNYEECLDSVVDEEYGTMKYMGEFSFTVDYPDSCIANAEKINHCICELTGISESERVKSKQLNGANL